MKSLADHLREIERTERMKYLFDHPAKSPLQKLRRSDGARNYSWSAVAREVRRMKRDRGVCVWRKEDDEWNSWTSDCDQTWCFEEGTPKENNVRYCHFCGKRVKIGRAAK